VGNKFKLDQVLQKFEQAKKSLPAEIATEAKNFMQDNFRKQGFQDGGIQKWKEVQRRIPGTKAYKYPKKKDLGRRTRRILNKTGLLQGSIRTVSATFRRIAIGTNVYYAKFVNDKRKYLGRSRQFERKLHKDITIKFAKCFGDAAKR
jgi:phage gpG-like protein